jgi:hypothetical protein
MDHFASLKSPTCLLSPVLASVHNDTLQIHRNDLLEQQPPVTFDMSQKLDNSLNGGNQF